ncbi:regulatory protein [Lutibacter oricola]|uniref:Regulatory protein RecX n=1 Tax=Lutibacter oricola TaxID=762486 RepID=A0A1H3DVF5_9FLAO|nr:regulatory protein RecX [Lutibacter oricola]SDX70098.1 regulatory protein [Lutibacter oricola]
MPYSKTYTVTEATRLLEKYCAYQERCHKEVEQKLHNLNMITEAKELIILHLMEHNFLNEERFSKAFVRGKFSIKKWGKIKIVNELKFKNISTYNIKSGLKEINENQYLQNLDMLASKKINLVKESNSYKKRVKVFNYLKSKGYENDIINNCLNKLL